jgi:hypothetical protein
MRIAVYTSIFGNKDSLNDPINYSLNSEIEYFCFTDHDDISSSVYNIIISLPMGKDFSKSSKYYKILGHRNFEDFDYAVYHDGNIQMDHSKLKELVDSSKNYFLSNFMHPHRNCFYDEAIACIKREKDSYLVIFNQVISYFFRGMPKGTGLRENGILVINKKESDFEFFELWWGEVNRYSKRDQLSFPFLVNKMNIKIGVLEGVGVQNNFSIYHSHFLQVNSKEKSFLFKIKKKIIIQLIKTIKKIR